MLSRRRLLLLFIPLTAAVGIPLLIAFSNSESAQLQEATTLLSSNPGQVSQRAAAALAASPGSPEWLDLAAVASERTRDYTAAVQYLQRLHAVRKLPTERLLKLARLAELSGDLLAAEAVLSQLVRDEPNSEVALRQLVNLLLAECRRFETQPLLRRLVQNRSFLLDELAMLGSREELLSDEALLKAARNSSSRPLALMAQASAALFLGKPEDALNILEGVPLPSAGQAEFVSVVARGYVGKADEDGMAAWAQEHSSLLETHPDGAWCLAWLAARQGHLDSARSFFLKALSLDYNHRAALQQFGSLLAAANYPEAARPLLERAQLLNETEQLLHRVLTDDQTAPQMLRIATAMEQLGRLQEAWAWHMAVAGYHPAAAAASSKRSAELEQQLQLQPEFGNFPEDLHRQLAAMVLTDRSADSRQTKVAASGARLAPVNQSSPADAPEPRFEDHAESLGIVQPWFFGQSTSEPRGLSVLQGFGGGVAAFDFDNDLWTDLCFTQGSALPRETDDSRSTDILLRNVRGLSAASAPAALPPDFDYGQGIAAGDFNEDGFSDLLIASTVGTRLLQNNGDGSFTDITAVALPSSAGWVTSCAIADVTGDGIADLFEVRYADGSDPQTKLCPSGPARLPRSCRPDLFPAAPDRLLAGDGSGAFTVAGADFFPPDEGRGLGLLIGDFDDSGHNSAFISNDMTPNALRVLQTNAAAGTLPSTKGSDADSAAFSSAAPGTSSSGAVTPAALIDIAALRGCAVNGAGRIQAGMGIAWGDFNRDDFCDFFVTNFLAETNTLFASAAGGFFEDLSSSTGADAGSLDLLSFGAQAVDANLDGLQDLFVLNGHVDDYQHFDLPWKMPPAAWIAVPNGRFQRGSPDVFGTSSKTPALGRALARLDWNRDGKNDLVATFLDRHPALFINVSRTVGRPLRVSTIGTRSCRHPVGASLSLDSGDQAFPRQRSWVTAGDGYYSACEHTSAFALSVAHDTSLLTIRWPSHAERQQFSIATPVDEIALIEGRSTIYALPH